MGKSPWTAPNGFHTLTRSTNEAFAVTSYDKKKEDKMLPLIQKVYL